MQIERIEHTPSRRRLLWISGAALLAASLIVVAAILPAEFHIDPLGVGRITGLLQMSAPVELKMQASSVGSDSAPAHFYATPFRTDTIDIPLASSTVDYPHAELEWKVRMKAGDSLVYSWSVEAPADEFYFDFHGQSDPKPDVKVLSYREGLGNTSNGAMTAPFDGIHGWFFQNQSEKPVVVHLKLSGFYEMRPDPYAPE